MISLLGKEKARKKSEELIASSLKILKKFGKDAENLIDLTNFIISRKMTSNIENESFINKFKNRRLDSLLVDKKLVTSRKEAVSLIMTGGVFVEEKKVDKPGKIIKLNQKISLKNIKKIGYQGVVIN